MGSRFTVTSKMELFVTIFDSSHSLTIATKISILDVSGVLDPTLMIDILFSCVGHLVRLSRIILRDNFHLAELDLNQFEVNFRIQIPYTYNLQYIEIGQSILMAKKMAGCYEIGIY